MNNINVESRTVLFTEGPNQFLGFACELFNRSDKHVLTVGKSAELENIEALGTNGVSEPRERYAVIRERGLVLEALILSVLWQSDLTPESTAKEVSKVVDYIKMSKEVGSAYPKYVVIAAPRHDEIHAAAGRASLKTLTGYLTSHLLNEDVRINLCLYVASDLGYKRAAETVFALCSGLLDDVRGQELVLGE